MPIRLVLVALAVAAALPVPVLAASGSEQAAHTLRSPPPINLVADPATPVVGAPVTVRVVGATGQPADYQWTAPDAGISGRDTGSSPLLELRFQTPGIHLVAVKLSTDGATRNASLSVSVRPKEHAASSPAPAPPKPAAAPAARPAPRPAAHVVSAAPRAHAAGDPGVTIVDFNFNPGSITIHTGDTITWTNTGSQPHTATANDHSFDTGILNKGQSGSHVFNQAGTFSYFCTVHPFMKATVTVVSSSGGGGGSGSGSGSGGGSGSGSGSGSSSTGSGAASGSSGSTSASSGQNLPFTGFNLMATALVGLLLVGSGAALRWWARGSRRATVRP